MSNSLNQNFKTLSLLKFALPSMIMMVFMSLYTIIDGIFVSRLVGESALSAVNIVWPVICILIAIGVFLCIISPIFPIIGDMIGITFIENIMVAVMLAVIAIAVGFFVLSGIMLKQFDDIKYKQCRVDYQSASYIQNECDHMRTIHSLCLSIGVALCVMSVIPPIIIDALNFEILDDLGGAGVLCFVGIGVFLIVYQANASKAYKVLLSLNNPDTISGNYAKPANKSVEYINPTATAIMSVYWSTVSCIYLSISFLTFYWHITWVIWPIAGVIYALLKNVLRK